MPRIPLSDSLGIDVDGKLAPLSVLSSLPILSGGGMPLDGVPVESGSLGLQLERPIPVDAGGLKLKLGGGSRIALSVISPGKRTVDADDPFDAIRVGADEAYLGLRVTFAGELGASRNHLGIDASRDLTIACYRRFRRGGDEFASLPLALAAVARSFVLPHSQADLDGLDADTVVMLTGSGSLQLSAALSMPLAVEALAPVRLGPATIDVSAGGSLRVNAGITLRGGYQVRVRRASADAIEIGVHRAKSREVTVSAAAQASIGVGVGSFELTERLITALSNRPLVNREEFRAALPGEDDDSKRRRMEGFERELKAAVDTRVRASVTAAFSALHSEEAALLYEIQRGAAPEAVLAALRGKFGLLAADPAPAGVVQKQNILTTTDARKTALKLNLLGIVNAMSAVKLTQVSRIERNAEGEITLLVDTSSASRMSAVLVNLNLTPQRLRSLMSENFLIEAAYHASGAGVLPPVFTSRHPYLEVHGRTGRGEMKNNLDVIRAFGAMTADQVKERLGRRRGFRRTTFYIEASYRGDALRNAFLDANGAPRTVAEYEECGRRALGELVAGDSNARLRHRVATDSQLWAEMKRIGNAGQFAPLFGPRLSATDPRVGAAGGDYLAIVSWAAAMHAAAEAVQGTIALLQGGGVMSGDARLAEARARLNARLKNVVARTEERFGDPLGMLMVYLAAQRRADVTIVLEGEQIDRFETRIARPTA